MKEGWRKLQVREVLKLEYGKPLPKEDRSANGEFSAYGSNGIKCRTDRAYFDRTSIIVGRKGSAGQITLVDGPFWPLDVTYFVTHDDRQHDIKFLYHLLKRLELPMLAEGVKPGINRNRVYDLEAAFPPLPEQKRIVAILDEAFAGIDRAIANTEKNLANAREVFESYLNDTYYKAGKDLGNTRLSELIEITHGFAFKGPEFSVSDDVDKPIVLTPGNYAESGVLYFNKKNTKRFTGNIPSGYSFEPGDLTVVMTDLSSKMKILGKPAFVDQPNVLHNQRIGRILFKRQDVEAKFIYYFLRTKGASNSIRGTATGTMVRHTAPKRILSLPIPFPLSLEDQANLTRSFDELSQRSDQLGAAYCGKLANLTDLKQSILQKAFAGELTTKPDRILAKAGA